MKSSTFSFSLILSLVLFVGIGYYSYTRFTSLANVKSDIAMLNQGTAELLRNTDSENALLEAKNMGGPVAKATELKKILPPLPFKTDLYRELEAYFEKLNQEEPPMIVNSINIPDPQNDKELGYSIIPIQLNIESSQANFYKFLEWIESSGYFSTASKNSKDATVQRLMSIESIQIQLPDESKESGETKSEIETYKYNVTLNTYLQLQGE